MPCYIKIININFKKKLLMKQEEKKMSLMLLLGWITFLGLWISCQFPLFEKTAAIAPNSFLSYSCFALFIAFSIAIIIRMVVDLRANR